MARAGAFRGVNAAIMAHPYFIVVDDQAWMGRRECSVTYRGISAHASSHPFMGRNALDAAYGLAAVALDFLGDNELAAEVLAEFEAAGGGNRC